MRTMRRIWQDNEPQTPDGTPRPSGTNPMTKEEAAEIILVGEPFKPCAECDGLGFPSGSKDCDVCLQDDVAGGTGKVYNLQYVKACEVLGLELPEATWDMDWYRQHTRIKYKRIHAERRSYRSGEEVGKEMEPSDDRT